MYLCETGTHVFTIIWTCYVLSQMLRYLRTHWSTCRATCALTAGSVSPNSTGFIVVSHRVFRQDMYFYFEAMTLSSEKTNDLDFLRYLLLLKTLLIIIFFLQGKKHFMIASTNHYYWGHFVCLFVFCLWFCFVFSTGQLFLITIPIHNAA